MLGKDDKQTSKMSAQTLKLVIVETADNMTLLTVRQVEEQTVTTPFKPAKSGLLVMLDYVVVTFRPLSWLL